MRPARRAWVGIACGLAIGVGGAAALDATTGSADAQASEVEVTETQLLINQRISQAAVRRSNRALNYLAPIRTQQTDNADDGRNGVTPLQNVPGSGQGWTNSQIANEAISSEKVAAGAIGTEQLANAGVTGGKLDPVVASRIPRWAAVDSQLDSTVTVFFAQSGATAVEPTGAAGRIDVTFDVPATEDKCAAFVTLEGGDYNESANVTFLPNGKVRVFTYDASTNALEGRDFFLSLYCNP